MRAEPTAAVMMVDGELEGGGLSAAKQATGLCRLFQQRRKAIGWLRQARGVCLLKRSGWQTRRDLCGYRERDETAVMATTRVKMVLLVLSLFFSITPATPYRSVLRVNNERAGGGKKDKKARTKQASGARY